MRLAIVLHLSCACLLAGCTRINPDFDDHAEDGSGDVVHGPLRATWGLSDGSRDDTTTETGSTSVPNCSDFLWGSSHDGTLWVIDVERERAERWAKIESGTQAIATEPGGDLLWLPARDGDTDLRRFDPFDIERTFTRIPLAFTDDRTIVGAALDDGRLWTVLVGDRTLYELELDAGRLRTDRSFALDLGQDGDIARVGDEMWILTAFAWLLPPNAAPISLLVETDDAPPAVATGLAVHENDLWVSDVDGDMHRYDGRRLQARFSVGGPVTDLAPVSGTPEECDRLAAALDD